MEELDPLAHIPEPIKHTAARIEDWIHEQREANALRAGRLPAIVAYAEASSSVLTSLLPSAMPSSG